PAWFGQAVACQLENSHAEALRIYERLLEAQPNREELLANAMVAAVGIRDGARTRSLAARLLQVRPQSIAAHLALSWLALEEGDFDAASEHCGVVVQSNPSDFGHCYNFGVCLLRLHQTEKAATAFDRCLRLRPEDPNALEGMARCLTTLKRYPEA